MRTALRIFVFASALVWPVSGYAQHAPRIVPPDVPADIRVDPAEFVPFLVGHAVGTQGYFCSAIGASYTWVPFGPQATLYNADNQQILTHFLSPTPYSLVPAPTWQSSRDSSIVWGQLIAPSTDAAFVAPDAIAWLLLEAAVVGDGPTGGDRLLPTRRIQRVHTVEGKAPANGCSQPGDIGKRALVPYEADYYFYKDKPTRSPRD
jgi:uncharacterized protein DUF3455